MMLTERAFYHLFPGIIKELSNYKILSKYCLGGILVNYAIKNSGFEKIKATVFYYVKGANNFYKKY